MDRGLKTSKRDDSISRGGRLGFIVYWWFIPNRKWLISWGKIFLKVWSSQLKNISNNAPLGLILKIVPHLWTSEASLRKRSGAFAFKAFRALAAALQDDRRAVELATFHPFATFPPFFCPCPLLQLARAFRGAKIAFIWDVFSNKIWLTGWNL